MNEQQHKRDHLALAQAIKDSQESFLIRTEAWVAIATELKAKFDALVEVGFTPEQAMGIINNKVI